MSVLTEIDWHLKHFSVNDGKIRGIPDDEPILLARSSQELFVVRKLQANNSFLQFFENVNGLLLCVVPQYDLIWHVQINCE